jgi:hypothetical protein
MSESNLRDIIWGDMERSQPVLVTPREGQGLRHGVAVARMLSNPAYIRFLVQCLHPPERIALDLNPLVVMGNPSEFSRDVYRFLLPAGYPNRLEMRETSGKVEILERISGSAPVQAAAPSEHAGLAFFGIANDFSERPTSAAMGTDPLGLLMAVTWLISAALEKIPAPPDFPGKPIEALVRTSLSEGELPALSDLDHPARLLCGNYHYDFAARTWRPDRLQIRVLTCNNVPTVMFVGDTRVDYNQYYRPRVLWILIKRTVDGLWTTLEDIQTELRGDGPELRLLPTARARIGDVRDMAPGIDFVKSRKALDSNQQEYILDAEITISGHSAGLAAGNA